MEHKPSTKPSRKDLDPSALPDETLANHILTRSVDFHSWKALFIATSPAYSRPAISAPALRAAQILFPDPSCDR
jgi:hypothetical protein